MHAMARSQSVSVGRLSGGARLVARPGYGTSRHRRPTARRPSLTWRLGGALLIAAVAVVLLAGLLVGAW